MSNSPHYLKIKHEALKVLVEEATGDKLKVLKKEKLFVKDMLEKSLQLSNNVL